jgi:hypothetical protein
MRSVAALLMFAFCSPREILEQEGRLVKFRGDGRFQDHSRMQQNYKKQPMGREIT